MLDQCVKKNKAAREAVHAPEGMLEILTPKRAPVITQNPPWLAENVILICNLSEATQASPDRLIDTLGLFLVESLPARLKYWREVMILDSLGHTIKPSKQIR